MLTTNTKLDSDLTDCPADGLVIGAAGITVDLNGHTVDGQGAGDGVDDSAGYDRVTIEDGRIHEFSVGTRLDGASRNRLANLELVTVREGIVLAASNRNRIARNTVGDAFAGILLDDSDANAIVDNEVLPSVAFLGISVHGDDNVVRRNIPAADPSIRVVGDRNQVERNDARRFNNGIFVTGSENEVIANLALNISSNGSGNLISRNSVFDGLFGVGVRGSDTDVTDNRVLYGIDSGIVVRAGSSNIFVARNTVSSSLAGGGINGIIVEAGSTGVELARNLSTANGDDGIDVQSPGTVVRHNTANDNGDLGIEAVPGVVDGGGNRASGNGNPAQCVGVFCS